MPSATRARNQIAEAFGEMRAGYDMARQTRFERRRDVPLMGAPADYHLAAQSEWLRTVEYARDMDRNDVVVGGIIDRAATNILLGNEGIRVDPQTGDEKLDQAWRERWEDWASNADACDVAGENAWPDIEWLALRQTFIDGDHFVLATDADKLQLIEAHRCRTPSQIARSKRKIIHGVELDSLRRRLRFWFTKNDVEPRAPLKYLRDVTAYDARDSAGFRKVMHTHGARRVSQTRGVSALAPMKFFLGAFEDINFAKLVQQQVVSCFAIFRQLDLGADDSAPAETRGERTPSTHADGQSRLLEGIAPGMELFGRAGEKITGFSPNIPNPEFFQHVRLILQLVGANLGLPLVLVLLDASETNFSGWRGAIEEARKGFRRLQSSFIRRLHQPVWLWRVREWLRDDKAAARATGWSVSPSGVIEVGKTDIKPFKHRWNPPAWPYIQPLQDAGTDLLRVRNGLISPRRLHAERNRDFGEIAKEIAEDNGRLIVEAKTRAAEINRQFPDDPHPVHWRECIALPTPDGVRLSLQGGADTSTQNNKGNNDD